VIKAAARGPNDPIRAVPEEPGVGLARRNEVTVAGSQTAQDSVKARRKNKLNEYRRGAVEMPAVLPGGGCRLDEFGRVNRAVIG